MGEARLPIGFVRYSGGEPTRPGRWAPIYEDLARYHDLPHWESVEVVPVDREAVSEITDEMVERGARAVTLVMHPNDGNRECGECQTAAVDALRAALGSPVDEGGE